MVQLRNQGIILGEDSEKMSKSRGNVVAPDTLVSRYGADTVRAYLMFFARWDMGAPWNSSGIEGTIRWIGGYGVYFTEEAVQEQSASQDTLRGLPASCTRLCAELRMTSIPLNLIRLSRV